MRRHYEREEGYVAEPSPEVVEAPSAQLLELRERYEQRVRESIITTNQQRGMSPEQARENAQARTERIMRDQRENKR